MPSTGPLAFTTRNGQVVNTPSIIFKRCNPFGAETGGASKYMGDKAPKALFHQWYCRERAAIRCRMTCEHGHVGQVMDLCMKHFTQFRFRDMTYCPTCNREPPGHKCVLSLLEVS
jgi:hypothetical protein